MHFTNQKAFLNGKSLLKAFTLLNWYVFTIISIKKPIKKTYSGYISSLLVGLMNSTIIFQIVS